MKNFVNILLVVVHLHVSAQTGVGNPDLYRQTYEVKDCFVDSLYTGRYTSSTVKPNNIIKGNRIWRSISLNNNQNQQSLNQNKNCLEIGLFEIIKFGVFEKQLHVFSSDNFAAVKTSLLRMSDVLRILSVNDTVFTPVFNENGEQLGRAATGEKYLMGSDIKGYLLKEDWISSSQSGKLEKHIIALAPLVYDPKVEKHVPLFWLYYPEWKEFFSIFYTQTIFTYEVTSYEEVFRKHYFVSQISKESNVFDRMLKSTNHGEDLYLENERIKEKLKNAESDLFQY